MRLAALLLAVAVAVPLHGSWRLFRRPSPWPRLFLGWVGRIVGAKARTIGTPLHRDVFFVSNHLSWIDVPVLAGATGSTFVAKSELRAVPVIGWLCTLNHTLFVERGDRMRVGGQIAMIRAAIAGGRAITIFAEGTTNHQGGLLPFKPALLGVLDPPPPGVRVQPVLVDYGPDTRRLAWGDEPGVDHARRVLARPGSFPVTLRFLEPFDPADFPGRKAITAEARARMAAALPPALLPSGDVPQRV